MGGSKMKWLKKRIENIKYRAFVRWCDRQYIKFIKKDNYDFDWCSIVDMNILKLTIMGLRFAKYGEIIDKDRKKQVRTIWAARRELKHVRDAFEINIAKAEKAFKEEFGFEYHSKMVLTPCEDKPSMSVCTWELITPTPKTLEEITHIEKRWRELFPFESEWEFQKASLRKAHKIIEKNIWKWWD
jgi:hypothetical protein